MMNLKKNGILCLLFTAIQTVVFSQGTTLPGKDLFGRKYKKGEIYRYRLTLDEIHNEQWQFRNISECEMQVKDTAGIYFDEVHWLSAKTIRVKDTANENQYAIAVKPYRISLDPRKMIMTLPKIEIPEMTEAIEDFQTFFVAISPMLGAYRLGKTGDSAIMPQQIKADFSNGANIKKGDDCFAISVRMIGEKTDEVIIQTRFMPTSKPCFPYILAEMNTPVIKDTANNFQEVTQTGNDQFTIQYGREMFYINSTIRKSDGKILHAEMFNTLNLKTHTNCNSEYKNCQDASPTSMQRNLRLELL